MQGSLFDAIEKKDVALLKSLLDSCNVNERCVDQVYATPLSHLMHCDRWDSKTHGEMFRILIEAGARIDVYCCWHDVSILYCTWRNTSSLYFATKKADLLLHCGAQLKPDEIASHYSTLLIPAHHIMRERVARCRRLCIALFKAPFQQRDLKVWWIQTMVWPTRYNEIWTPDAKMPAGFT